MTFQKQMTLSSKQILILSKSVIFLITANCLESKCHLNSTKKRTNPAFFKILHTFFTRCPAVSEMLKGTCGLSSGPIHQRAEMDSGERKRKAPDSASRLSGLDPLVIHYTSQNCKNKCTPWSVDDAQGLEWKCSFKVMGEGYDSLQVLLYSVCMLHCGEKKSSFLLRCLQTLTCTVQHLLLSQAEPRAHSFHASSVCRHLPHRFSV